MVNNFEFNLFRVVKFVCNRKKLCLIEEPLEPFEPVRVTKFLGRPVLSRLKILFNFSLLDINCKMGKGQSKPRSVSFDNETPGIIDISEDVVSRLKRDMQKGKNCIFVCD